MKDKGSPVLIPLTAAWNRRKRIYRSRQYFQGKVAEAIGRDPGINDSSTVNVEIDERGMFRRHVLRLTGKVFDPREREQAESIARSLALDVLDVTNEITVTGNAI